MVNGCHTDEAEGTEVGTCCKVGGASPLTVRLHQYRFLVNLSLLSADIMENSS